MRAGTGARGCAEAAFAHLDPATFPIHPEPKRAQASSISPLAGFSCSISTSTIAADPAGVRARGDRLLKFHQAFAGRPNRHQGREPDSGRSGGGGSPLSEER